MMNALTPAARLEGLIPVTEDWHTKVALLGVSYKQYVFNEVINCNPDELSQCFTVGTYWCSMS